MAADRVGLETIGWRNTCFAWAAAHILIGLPINWLMLPPVAGAKAAVAAAVKPHIPLDRTMILLAFAFAAAWSVTGAMAAHLPRILESAGATSLQAVAAGALIGPSQVAARIFEASFLSRITRCCRDGSPASPTRSARPSLGYSAAARPACSPSFTAPATAS
jgi:hypothetical protein